MISSSVKYKTNKYINKQAKPNQTHRYRQQICGYQRGKGVWGAWNGKGSSMYHSRWKLEFWWWAHGSVFRYWRIILYTWDNVITSIKNKKKYGQNRNPLQSLLFLLKQTNLDFFSLILYLLVLHLFGLIFASNCANLLVMHCSISFTYVQSRMLSTLSSLLSLNTSEQTKLSMQDLVTSHARYPLTKVSLEAASKCFSV